LTEILEKEYKIDGWLVDDRGCYVLKTKLEVLHAETNCLAKVARSGESSAGATMFVTMSTCFDCAKLIYQAGIIKVYFGQQYREGAGVDFLKKYGVDVEQYDV